MTYKSKEEKFKSQAKRLRALKNKWPKKKEHQYLTEQLEEERAAKEFEWDEESSLASYCHHNGPCDFCKEREEKETKDEV